jgi:alpha-beta hydrolase superfamily lysophospholipase
MLIRNSIINSTLAILLSVNFGAFALEANAQDVSEAGSKDIRVPTKSPKNAPCVSWLPQGTQPRVAMLCIHGFSLHKGCFAQFGEEMAKDGIATYAMDMRGFGELKDKREHTELDFDGCLVDIKAQLEQIHKNHPGLPVIILGESMGGAIALRATALYPNLVSGLISCVPARDRTGLSESEAKAGIKAGVRTIFGGYSKPIENVASAAVQKISDKDELRSQWKNDPLMRTNFSAKEFVQFDNFMAHNLAAAGLVKDTPVLFIQGTNDKLIRPAGTWKLYERLSTPNRQIVLSKNSEHLIFEEGQFRPDDLSFVTTWIDRNIAPLDPRIAASMSTLPVVASKEEYSGTETADLNNSGLGTEGGNAINAGGMAHTVAGANGAAGSGATENIANVPPQAPATEFQHRIASKTSQQINFWIELCRNGNVYRCNNKMEFKSGDSIRFHMIPGSDGYAYLVMKAGTTGKSDILFPSAVYGTDNYLSKGKDYPVPATGWMQFDQHPGIEQLGLVFASQKVDCTLQSLKNQTLTCFVSPEQSGSKDLCPTRMKLSWDDPTPVMIPDDFSAISQLHNSGDSSLIHLISTGTEGMVSANIQLMHGK